MRFLSLSCVFANHPSCFNRRSDENARAYYQPDIKAEQILTGEVQIPSWCLGLHETIRAAEGELPLVDISHSQWKQR